MASSAQGIARSGGCLCGAVRFDPELGSAVVHGCSCGICRGRSGGIFMAAECERVTVADESVLGVYRSSDHGERAFCRHCGSSLLWRMRDGSAHAVGLQALHELSGTTLTSDIFIDEKPPFYAFANETRNMTGAEFIAAATGEGA